jgi:formamidopyrimidine-DNA glycosylase
VPELPEVETTRRGIAPHLIGRRVVELIVRRRRLRWPVPTALATRLAGETIHDVSRRAKYLLLETGPGAVLIHLGMSGSLRVLARDTPPRRHDHIDLVLDSGRALRFNDPRRFGCWLWQRGRRQHPLLAAMGPDPLSTAFHADFLQRAARGRSLAVKSFLMDQRVVAGLGNIYAGEALFVARVHPAASVAGLSRRHFHRIAAAVREVLTRACAAGEAALAETMPAGLPLTDFAIDWLVYDRAGQPCRNCGAAIQMQTLAQRSSYFCPRCQRTGGIPDAETPRGRR